MVEEDSQDTFEINLPPNGGEIGWAQTADEAQERGTEDFAITPQIDSIEEFDTVLEGLIVASASDVSIEEIRQSLHSHAQHLSDEVQEP